MRSASGRKNAGRGLEAKRANSAHRYGEAALSSWNAREDGVTFVRA